MIKAIGLFLSREVVALEPMYLLDVPYAGPVKSEVVVSEERHMEFPFLAHGQANVTITGFRATY